MDEESEACMANNLNDMLTTDTADPTVSVDIPIFFYNDSIFLLLSNTGPILTFTAPGHLPERPCLLFVFVTFPFAG